MSCSTKSTVTPWPRTAVHHEVHDAELLLGGHAARGLVEQQELGPRDERHRHVEQLADALRQDPARPAYGSSESAQDFLRRLLGVLGLRDALGDEQVLAHAERGEKLGIWNERDSPMPVISRRVADKVMTIEADTPLSGRR